MSSTPPITWSELCMLKINYCPPLTYLCWRLIQVVKLQLWESKIVDIGAIQSCLLSSNYSVFDNIKQFLFSLIKYIEYIERFSCIVSNGVLRWLGAWEHKIWISLLGNFVQIFDGSKYVWWVTINAWKQLLEASNLVFLGFLREIFGCEKVRRCKQGSERKWNLVGRQEELGQDPSFLCTNLLWRKGAWHMGLYKLGMRFYPH